MKNKIKLIDRLKSWLLTLGIASVFGLAALGVNAANSYQKASAYEYQDNGVISLYIIDGDINYDANLLFSYFRNAIYNEVENNSDMSLDDFDFDLYTEFLIDNRAGDEEQQSYRTGVIEVYGSLSTGFTVFLTYTNRPSQASTDNNLNLEFTISNNNLSHISFTNEGAIYMEGFLWFSSLPGYLGYQELRNYVLSYNAPQESGNFVTALTSFMSLIGGGIVQLAQSVGAGVVSFASGLFLESGHLSILGGIIGIFAGIALAVGITSKVYAWVTTLGN